MKGREEKTGGDVVGERHRGLVLHIVGADPIVCETREVPEHQRLGTSDRILEEHPSARVVLRQDCRKVSDGGEDEVRPCVERDLSEGR